MAMLVFSSISCISSCRSDRILLLQLITRLEAVEQMAAIKNVDIQDVSGLEPLSEKDFAVQILFTVLQLGRIFLAIVAV